MNGAQLNRRPLDLNFADWRPGDQRYYVSDTSKFATATQWQPQVCVKEGLQRLYGWLCERNDLPQSPKKASVNGARLPQRANSSPHSPIQQESELVYGD